MLPKDMPTEATAVNPPTLPRQSIPAGGSEAHRTDAPADPPRRRSGGGKNRGKANPSHIARARARARGSFSYSRITPPPEHPAYTDRAYVGPVPGRLIQASVRACEAASWSTYRWPAEGAAEAEEVQVAPFFCKSYRCRRCGSLVARDDYRRIEAAAKSRAWWLYAVLTFDPKAWDSSWSCYSGAGELWDKRLRRRLERSYGKLDYVQTWERHTGARQFPHMNILMTGPGLREAVLEQGIERRWDARGAHGKGRWCRFPKWRTTWLAKVAPQCGFGQRVWAEPVENAGEMAAYLTKAAHDLAGARWKDGDQTPIGAPPHFRRFRASRGLLPPRAKPDPGWTGILSKRSVDDHLDRMTGELWIDGRDIDEAQRAKARSAEWAATHDKPAPRYEH